MSFNQSVLICDQVDSILENILKKNGLQVTSEPQITPEELAKKIGSFDIHRLGFGSRIDKYLLPFLGPVKALGLNRRNDYQVAWGIMASYGSLAAIIFSFFSRVSALVSLYEGNIKSSRKLIPFYKIIFRRAHGIQIIAQLTGEQSAWLEDDKKIRPVGTGAGWDYVAKKTKEEFQEMEILSSRL